MAELPGVFQAIEKLKRDNPISYRQAFLETRGDSLADGHSYWPETRRILDEAGITEDGVMTQESKDIFTGKTKRQLESMSPKQRLRELLQQNRTAIISAMPKHVTQERLMRVAQTACTSAPLLLECYVPSLLGGIMQAAQFGLEPNTPMGHCYLVPYRRNLSKRGQTPQYRQDCQLILGYRGLIDLARRSGHIVSISAHEVRENDMFEFEFGLEEKLRHRPASTQRGALIHFYAVAKLKGGGYAMDVMSVEDVREIMLGTHSSGKWGPWKDNFVEMGRKTAIRRLSKYLPMTIEMAQASQGDSTTVELSPDGSMDSVLLDGRIDGAAGESKAGQDEQEPLQHPDGEPADDWPVKMDDGAGGTQWCDKSGQFFDPTLHAMAKNGHPAVVGDGTFRARRGTGAQKPPRTSAPTPRTSAPTPTNPAQDAHDGTPPEDPANGGAGQSYDGPTVDAVKRMIKENISDEEGLADVRAIVSDMPDNLPGKNDCLADLKRIENSFSPF